MRSNILQFKRRETPNSDSHTINKLIRRYRCEDDKILIVVSGKDSNKITELLNTLIQAAGKERDVIVKNYGGTADNKYSIVHEEHLEELDYFLLSVIINAGYDVDSVM